MEATPPDGIDADLYRRHAEIAIERKDINFAYGIEHEGIREYALAEIARHSNDPDIAVTHVTNLRRRDWVLAEIAVRTGDRHVIPKITNDYWRNWATARLAIRESDSRLATTVTDRQWRQRIVAYIEAERAASDRMGEPRYAPSKIDSSDWTYPERM